MKKLILLILPAIFSVSAHAQDCPNGDFENWNIYPYSTPDSNWYNSNPKSLASADTLTVWPVPGFSGQAVHIQTAIIGTDTLQAFVINTLGDPTSGTGGVPYSQQPTAITGYYRYNMAGSDSALMIIEFKKSGSVISATQFTFRNAAGSISTFTPFSFPLNTIPVAPDSVVIGIASSNLMNDIGIQSGSWLEVDQLEFAGTGITQPIPGGSFDNWSAGEVDNPVGWQTQSNGNAGNGVTRPTTHLSGNYSLALTTQSGNGHGSNAVNVTQVTTGTFPQNSGPSGGLPYTRTADTLTGYYMYAPAGTDTGSLGITLTASGSVVGSFYYNFFAASTWTYFEAPISASATPDTMRIDIQSSSWNATVPGSVLNLDYLQLKSQPLPGLVVNNVAQNDNIVVYPNPANDVLNIGFSHKLAGPVDTKIYDMMGRILDKVHYNDNTAPSVITFQVGYLPEGIYFYEVSNSGNITRGKFLKE